jgi:hypothetical protein
MTVLERLAAELRREGGLMAEVVVDPAVGGDDPRLGEMAGAGPRAAGREDDYALLVETMREGYLQHYGTGRVVRPADPGLALLAGDRLYALGLSRLAEIGDLDATAVLADVISDCARAHAEKRGADAERIWTYGARAVGHGRDESTQPWPPAGDDRSPRPAR